MQKNLIRIAFVSMFLVAAGKNYAQSGSGTLAITGVTVIDGNGGAPSENQTLLVRNGRIEKIGVSSSIKIPKN
ncbi:MAG: hypothetical protein RIA63_00820, partial [Cyclobacteriaceae bacterium]